MNRVKESHEINESFFKPHVKKKFMNRVKSIRCENEMTHAERFACSGK